MENITPSQSKNGKKSLAEKSIQIDMTPMVDLGFLLITFFILATNFLRPNVMDLGLPANGHIENEIKDKNQVTFILGENNEVYYHQSNANDLQSEGLLKTYFEHLNISKIIAEAKKNAPDPEIFTVIIKPTDESNYKNFVDILDDIAITHTERYGLADLKTWEEKVYEQQIR
ncbi:ExbD/TolR family protein [Chryseobacterium sp.]|uniref:ExbD/TolR family protein n=1 Tax=Chryseobacterium sp. TaxID=1871047 RepID=UPI0011CB0720|nr:biopolymer transporter ExbD [Chryseobacterium sp.]TXF77241.1 biopolymer transporter ExbD [Chryseobacterium sp.]